MAKKLTQQEAEQKVKNYNSEYELTSEYVDSKSAVTIKHKCGNEYEIPKFQSFFEGKNRCKKCYPSQSNNGHSTKKVTEEDMINRLSKEFPDGEYKYVSGYTKMADKCLFLHTICNKTFSASPKMILGVKKTRCPFCSNKNRGSYQIKENYLQKLLNDADDGNEYEWKDEYYNDNKEKLEILHKKCNKTYKIRPNDFQQGYRCPYCALENNESKDIGYIKSLLEGNSIDFNTEIKFDSLQYKSQLSFDLKIDNILIEYDGIQHFKPTFTKGKGFEDQIIRDNIKNEWIQRQNEYSLLRIPPNLQKKDLKLIIDEVINKNNLEMSIIKKYNLYYYDSKNQVLYNSYNYYTNINKNFFNDYIEILSRAVEKPL